MSERLRGCVDYDPVVSHDDGDTAHVHFTVAEDCSDVTLSLVVYSLPGETFSVETADQQELLNATTGTFGPGEHTITVDLPGEGEGVTRRGDGPTRSRDPTGREPDTAVRDAGPGRRRPGTV